MQNDLLVLILAAGQGTRMKSSLPKVLHKVNGKPILEYIINRASCLEPKTVCLIVGFGSEKITERYEKSPVERFKTELKFVRQEKQFGTGHAVLSAEESLKKHSGDILILTGDTPLLTTELLTEFYKHYEDNNLDLAVLSFKTDDPTGYGRIIRDSKGNIEKIIEHKDATEQQRRIGEVNAGIYCIKQKDLLENLHKIGNSNAQGEYYLPDLINLYRKENKNVGCLCWDNPTDLVGVNTRQDLAQADKLLRERKMRQAMNSGVTVYDPQNTYIEEDVIIEKDSVVYPGVVLQGETRIGAGCVIHHYCRLSNVMLGNQTVVYSFSDLTDSSIGSRCQIGPFARLRPGNRISDEVKIGNFVEVKKSKIAKGTKASHLTYLGDAKIGTKVNIGAGTITCNYDGWNKYVTVIDDGVFVGSNTEIIAPVKIGKGSVIGAGTTVTDDIPEDSLAVSRTKQKNIERWAAKKRLKMEKGKKK